MSFITSSTGTPGFSHAKITRLETSVIVLKVGEWIGTYGAAYWRIVDATRPATGFKKLVK
jgi:hypothetical protein